MTLQPDLSLNLNQEPEPKEPDAMKTQSTKRLTLRGLKTVDVHALEWFDRVNGNSYFAATVTLNYGLPDAETLHLPFQYGYGSHYEWQAFSAIRERFGLPEDRGAALWSFCKDRGVILRTSKRENCRKRDLKALAS